MREKILHYDDLTGSSIATPFSISCVRERAGGIHQGWIAIDGDDVFIKTSLLSRVHRVSKRQISSVAIAAKSVHFAIESDTACLFQMRIHPDKMKDITEYLCLELPEDKIVCE